MAIAKFNNECWAQKYADDIIAGCPNVQRAIPVPLGFDKWAVSVTTTDGQTGLAERVRRADIGKGSPD